VDAKGLTALSCTTLSCTGAERPPSLPLCVRTLGSLAPVPALPALALDGARSMGITRDPGSTHGMPGAGSPPVVTRARKLTCGHTCVRVPGRGRPLAPSPLPPPAPVVAPAVPATVRDGRRLPASCVCFLGRELLGLESDLPETEGERALCWECARHA